jgi:hypothetical protein
MTPRRYALTKAASGDYLCPSNDGLYLWRFFRYEDGAAHGLEAAFQERSFWLAARKPMLLGEYLDLDDLGYPWDAPWVEFERALPSRKAAVAVMEGTQ